MCNSPCANMATLRAVAVHVVLLHKHDSQTSCKSSVMLPLLFPDLHPSFFSPAAEGSFLLKWRGASSDFDMLS